MSDRHTIAPAEIVGRLLEMEAGHDTPDDLLSYAQDAVDRKGWTDRMWKEIADMGVPKKSKNSSLYIEAKGLRISLSSHSHEGWVFVNGLPKGAPIRSAKHFPEASHWGAAGNLYKMEDVLFYLRSLQESDEPSADMEAPEEFLLRMEQPFPRIRISFEQLTPESAEHGDISDSGWVDEDGVSMVPDEFDKEEGLSCADLAAAYLKREGAVEASSSRFHPGVWYSTGFSTIDYATGTEEQRSYHLVDFSEAEERQTWDKMHQGRH